LHDVELLHIEFYFILTMAIETETAVTQKERQARDRGNTFQMLP
jgi:hypothetical protein